MSDVGLAEQQSGDKCAQGRRQPDEVGQSRDGKHQGDHHQNEYLAGPQQGEAAHYQGHDLYAQQGHSPDYNYSFQDAPAGFPEDADGASAAVQGRQHGDHQDEHQVLHKQEPGEQPAMQAVDFAPVG